MELSDSLKRRVLEVVIDQNDHGCLPALEEVAMITGVDIKKVEVCMKWLEERGYVNKPAYPHDRMA